jgi:hypothetical protein
VGKVVQSLLSVNCHDSCAHSHEQHGPFTRLDGFGWVGSTGLSLVGLVHDMQQVRSLCACFGLATGGMPVSIGRFWLQV